MLIHMVIVVIVACMQLLSPSVYAQSYPSRPVTIVVPYGPGGNADLAARSLAAVAPKYLGQPLIVINRAGAGGMIGSKFVIDAPKDGYTLLLARVGSQAVAPALDPAATYHWDDFSFLGMLEIDPYVCVVNGKSPLRNFDDLVRTLKATPGKLSYASTGNFDASVVFPVKILLNLGLSPDAAVKVPYKASSETITSLLGGQTDFTCNGISPYTSNIKAGTLRGLVVSTHDRVAQVPEVPTAKEVGMPDLELVSGWSALYGPPGLPKEVIDRWASVLGRLKTDSEWTEKPTKRGSVPMIMSPADTRAFVQKQYTAYKALAPVMAPK